MAAPGDLVTPNVRLVRLLGEGGMGAVWQARHEGLDTDVAVKLIAADLAQSASVRERFAREAKAAARIQSPHVVQMFDHGLTAQGVPYIVMELCQGETLRQRLERTRIDPAAVARILSELCNALAAAHALGIIHRDVKPDNVYLARHGGGERVKVLDFGIAKHELAAGRPLTVAGTAMGTPAYMSPDQIACSAKADPGFDVWGAAVCAYEALTGSWPFPGETLVEVTQSVLRGTYTPPSRRGLPPAFDAFFQRAFARDPKARFVTAAELASAFERAAAESTAAGSGRVVVGPAAAMASPEASYAPTVAPDVRPVPVAPPAPTYPPPAVAPHTPIQHTIPAGAPPPPPRATGVGAWIAVGLAACIGITAVALIAKRPWRNDESESEPSRRERRRRRDPPRRDEPPAHRLDGNLRVRPGDGIAKLRAAYDIGQQPTPGAEPNKVEFKLDKLGLWFFLEDDVIDVIRIEQPFAEPVEGVRLADPLALLIERRGQPKNEPFAFGNDHAYVYDAKEPGVFVRYDVDDESKLVIRIFFGRSS
jgi:eukaryotic-like serine/threonine-protein kinase